jgi:hypothetical protein
VTHELYIKNEFCCTDVKWTWRHRIQQNFALSKRVVLDITHAGGQTWHSYYVLRLSSSSSRKTRPGKQIAGLLHPDGELAVAAVVGNRRQLWRNTTATNLIGFRKPMRLSYYKLSIINRIKPRDHCCAIITFHVRNMSRHIFKISGFIVRFSWFYFSRHISLTDANFKYSYDF